MGITSWFASRQTLLPEGGGHSRLGVLRIGRIVKDRQGSAISAGAYIAGHSVIALVVV